MGGARLNTSEAGACFRFILLALPGAGAENNPSAETDLLPLLLLLMAPVRKGLFATIEFGMGGVSTFLEEENGSLWLPAAAGGNSDGGSCCGAGIAAKGFAEPPEGSKSNGDAPEITCALPWKSTPEDFFLVKGGTGAVDVFVSTIGTLPTAG
jgi:hypothetical protein